MQMHMHGAGSGLIRSHGAQLNLSLADVLSPFKVLCFPLSARMSCTTALYYTRGPPFHRMSGAEAVTAIQLIDACIGITNTIISIGRAVHDAQGLPPKLRDLFDKIPAIEELLGIAQDNIEQGKIAQDAEDSAKPILKQCKQALDELQEVFRKACPKDGENRSKRMWKGAKTVFFGRDSRVQGLLTAILDNLKLLEQKEVYIIGDRLDELYELAKNLGQDESGKYVHTGQGSIFANEGGNPMNNVASGSHSRVVVSHGSYHEAPSST